MAWRFHARTQVDQLNLGKEQKGNPREISLVGLLERPRNAKTSGNQDRAFMLVRQQGRATRAHKQTMEILQNQEEASQKGNWAGDSAVT